LATLQESIDALFDQFSREAQLWPAAGPGDGGSYLPSMDFTEEEDRYVLTAELPGVDKKDVSVAANGSSITIRGEKRDEKETRGRRFYRHERSFGRFLRALPIPEDADTDKIDASFRNGVLTVEIPRSEKAVHEGRKIEVHE
jgi:HSP20 family protein